MPLPSVIYLYPLNTQVVEIDGLQDVIAQVYLNSATVSATLFDQRGVADPVLNEISMGYVAGTNGNYRGIVPESFSPPAWTGQASLSGYSLLLTADQAGVQAQFTIPVILRTRSQQ